MLSSRAHKSNGNLVSQISLILHNARVLTMEPSAPTAGAVAIRADRIAAVGGDDAVCALAGERTTILDCGGRVVLPGFIDAHLHILAAAASSAEIDCAAGSIGELADAVGAAAESVLQGSWLRGGGYHEADLREGRHPNRHDLDRAVPNLPVRVTHVTGHASALNSEALKQLGIGIATQEPAGGQLERDAETGEPTGVLLEMEDWLDRRMPTRDLQEIEAGVRQLSSRLLAAGVTSVQDMGHRNNGARARLLAEFVERRVFQPRITLATGYEAFTAGDYAVAPGFGRGPVKIMLNETGGKLTPDAPELARRIREVHCAGGQVAIHAIEPRAIEAALDGIAAAQAEDGRRARHRIEHASITPPDIAGRMARLETVVVSNPAFVYEHGDRYLSTVERDHIPYLYDVAGLREAGVCVAAGSDSPVAPPEPNIGIIAALSRRTRSGARLAGMTMELERALESFTSAAAFAVGEALDKGRIAAGMLADLVVVDGDGKRLEPVITVLGGEVVWRSKVWPAPGNPRCP